MALKISECLMLAALLSSVSALSASTKQSSPQACSSSCEDIELLKRTISELSVQVMNQQNDAEERERTESYTGIKIVRGTSRGRYNYDSASFLSPSTFTMHDHSNYEDTVGIGELSLQINGVVARTRHNDYKLVMPSRRSREYHAYERIPFPDVPPEVLAKRTIEEQIIEMREWFRAFLEQDPSERNYTKYFKPVLCYLEGAWTLDKNLTEPFPSDRHSLDATSWEELHERNRFTTFTGVKNRKENIAHLPTKIMRVNKTTGLPEIAQWNYRIICNPLDFDLPTEHFQIEDDLSFRERTRQDLVEVARTRAARFKLFDMKGKRQNYQLLDEIFSKIPGKDNFGANLTFTIRGEEMYDMAYPDREVLLNTAYYHRSYKTELNGAGGLSAVNLGFNDDNLFMAQTTQSRVASFDTEKCEIKPNPLGKLATRCEPSELRVSHAFPLEIVYMTPLLKWNPYNLAFHTDLTITRKDGRNGGIKASQALNGTDSANFYRTPAEFFSDGIDSTDPADTVRNYVYVLDPAGTPRKVSASGTRILMQKIKGVGIMRQRYPIAPLSNEGGPIWKEVNALKRRVEANGEDSPQTIVFEMSLTVQDPPGEHTHQFSITANEYMDLVVGSEIEVTTDESQGHTHDLIIAYDSVTKSYKYLWCDGQHECLDGHEPPLTLQTKNKITKAFARSTN